MIGRWSTRRPWLAIGCWLGFVALLRRRARRDRNEHTQQRGDRAIGARVRADRPESPLHSSARARLPPQQAAARLRPGIPGRDPGRCPPRRPYGDVLSPLASGGVRLVSRDRHSALVVVALGDVRALTVRDAILAAQPAHPAITIEETGDITASDARDRVEQQRPAPRRAALDPGHAARPALRVRRARRGPRAGPARPDRRRRGVRPARARSARLFPIDDSVKTCRAPDRHGRRRRLRALLRDPLARGAPPRPALARGARAHGPHLRPHGARLGHDRRDRDGRHVRDRLATSSTASRAATITVVACAVAGSVTVLPARARAARAADRPRPDPVPAAPADRHRDSRFWPAVVDRVLRRPRLSCVARRRPARRARAPGARLHVGKPSDERSRARRASRRSQTLADVRRELPEHGRRRRSSSPPGRRAGAERRCARRARTPRALAVARGIAHRAVPLSRQRPTARAVALELPLTGAGRQRREPPRDLDAPRRAGPADARPHPRRRDGCHRRHRRGRRLHAPDEARHALRDRLRARCSRSCSCSSPSARSSCR